MKITPKNNSDKMLQHVDILVLARPSWKEGNGDHRERGCGFRKYNRNGNCNKSAASGNEELQYTGSGKHQSLKEVRPKRHYRQKLKDHGCRPSREGPEVQPPEPEPCSRQ